MNNNNKLRRYVKKSIKKGFDIEKIEEALSKAGYEQEVIDEICEEYKAKEEPKRGLNSRIAQLEEVLENRNEEKGIEKKFKIPWGIRRKLKTLAIKKKKLVLYLRRNRSITPMIVDEKDGFINIDGTPHNSSLDFTFLWNGKYPAMVVPEWDLNPVGTKDYYDAVSEKRTPDAATIVMRMLEARDNPTKAKLSPKAWIFIGIAIIAGLYVFMGGA